MIFIIICLLHIDYFGDMFLLFDVMTNKRLYHMKGMYERNEMSEFEQDKDLSENGAIFTLNLRS